MYYNSCLLFSHTDDKQTTSHQGEVVHSVYLALFKSRNKSQRTTLSGCSLAAVYGSMRWHVYLMQLSLITWDGLAPEIASVKWDLCLLFLMRFFFSPSISLHQTQSAGTSPAQRKHSVYTPPTMKGTGRHSHHFFQHKPLHLQTLPSRQHRWHWFIFSFYSGE